MLALIFRRLAISVPLLLLTSMITFVLQAFIPGDAARAIVGTNGTEAAYQSVRAALHLNEPIYQQYLGYLGRAVRGDLGVSAFSGQSVTSELIARLPATLALIIGATLLCTVIGVLIGMAGVRLGGPAAKAIEAISLLGLALPNFWIALVLVSLFSITIVLFPATGYVPFGVSPSLWIASLVLPVCALALAGIANIAKITRDGVTEALGQDYIRTLRSCGVGERALLWKHALRNAGVPIATLSGLYVMTAITGSVFVEVVFAFPGLGALLNTATAQHDIPVIQGVALAYTVIVIVANLLTDIACSVLNPKLRFA